MKPMNQVKSKQDLQVEKIHELDSKHELIRLIHVSLNIFGLIVVLLKDLPVWARPQSD